MMLETLLKILSWGGLPAPEILLEEDGDICLDWHLDKTDLNVSITPEGKINYSCLDHGHGTDLDELKVLMEALSK